MADDVKQARMRAVVAKALMEASPAQFPSLRATVRVAEAVADAVLKADGYVRYERTEQGWETTFHEPEGV